MKTMSIRMDRENYEFLHELTKEEPGDLSKAVRDLVYRGRIMLAVERYKKGEVFLGRAAALAGIHMSPTPPLEYPLLYHEPIRTEVEILLLREANQALNKLKNDAVRGAAVLQCP